MRTPSRSRGEHGFVLLAVLVVLVVLTLLAVAVATVSERALAQAQAESDAFEAELTQLSTRDTLLFLLATQRQTVAGLTIDEQVNLSFGNAVWRPDPDDMVQLPPPIPVGNEIPLDGTPLRGLGGTRFSLQDDAGLFSINWTPEPMRSGFLRGIGAEPSSWAGLEAKRLDYQDPDDRYRLGGAEAAQYLDAGLPPPANRTLLTPLALRRVMGWRDLLADWSDQDIVDRISASRVVVLNVNTAPADNLVMLPGADEASIARMLAQRRTQPFMLRWEFLSSFPLGLDEEAAIGFLAVGAGNLKLWNNAGGPTRLLHWTLTPVDETGRPWRIDYEITLPRDDFQDTSPARTPATPLLAPQDPRGRGAGGGA